MRHRAGGHGNHAGRLDDLFFELLLDATLFSLLQDRFPLFGGDETGVNTEAEDNYIVDTEGTVS